MLLIYVSSNFRFQHFTWDDQRDSRFHHICLVVIAEGEAGVTAVAWPYLSDGQHAAIGVASRVDPTTQLCYTSYVLTRAIVLAWGAKIYWNSERFRFWGGLCNWGWRSHLSGCSKTDLSRRPPSLAGKAPLQRQTWKSGAFSTKCNPEVNPCQRISRLSRDQGEIPEDAERLLRLQIGPDKVLPDMDNNSKMVSPVASLAQIILPLVRLRPGRNTNSDTDTEILCSEEQPTSTLTSTVWGWHLFLFKHRKWKGRCFTKRQESTPTTTVTICARLFSASVWCNYFSVHHSKKVQRCSSIPLLVRSAQRLDPHCCACEPQIRGTTPARRCFYLGLSIFLVSVKNWLRLVWIIHHWWPLIPNPKPPNAPMSVTISLISCHWCSVRSTLHTPYLCLSRPLSVCSAWLLTILHSDLPSLRSLILPVRVLTLPPKFRILPA